MNAAINPITKIIARVLLKQVIQNRYNPLITYGEVSERINDLVSAVGLKPYLYEISDACKEVGLPLLSAIVYGKETGVPGPGFYNTYFPGTTEDVDKIRVLNSCLNDISACDNWSELMKLFNIDLL